MANLTTIRYRNGSSWVNLLNFIYPVGAIYMSDRAATPASLFGGTWAQISGDRYLRASTNFSTGGSNTITAAQIPTHLHGLAGKGSTQVVSAVQHLNATIVTDKYAYGVTGLVGTHYPNGQAYYP